MAEQRVVIGVDIGNSTTEAAVTRIGVDGPQWLHGALAPTTGVKGTAKNAVGVAQVVAKALRASRVDPAEVGEILVNEATPVISGLAMETITETVITESTMIGHDPRTPGGEGLGIGVTTAVESLPDTAAGEEVIVVAPPEADFDDVSRAINAAVAKGVVVRAAILAPDDAVLVGNRLEEAVPIVDEVRHTDAVPLGMLAVVEVAPPGRTIRTLANPYGLASVFGLDAEQTRSIAPVSRALTGNRSAVVVRTPAGDVADRSIPAGALTLDGERGRTRIDVTEGAEAIMRALRQISPLRDAGGETGTNVGGMVASVRETMADMTGQEVADVNIQDLLAVDTFAPLAVRGGLADEVADENAVALSTMVRTSHGPMQEVARAVRTRLADDGLDVAVRVGGIEAEMAVRGAQTTPGTGRPLVVLDMGGGSTDAALIEPAGDIRSTHLAGAGDLVTRLIDSELGLEDLELAEMIKRHPLGKVESFFHLRLEDGTVQFQSEPVPDTCFARVVVLTDEGMLPVPTRHSIDHILRVRRTAKSRVFAVNAVRALEEVAPTGGLRQIDFVVLLGGCALDFEIPELIGDALAPFGIVCGTGNVRGVAGPRSAVATGLVMAHLEAS